MSAVLAKVAITYVIGTLAWNATLPFMEDGRLGDVVALPSHENVMWYNSNGWVCSNMIRGSYYGGVEVSGVRHTSYTARSRQHSWLKSDSTLLVTSEDTSEDTGNSLQVIHEIRPSPVEPQIIQTLVTVTNNGANTMEDVRYRRYEEIDVGDKFDTLTVRGAATAPGLLFLHNYYSNGRCNYADPLTRDCNTEPTDLEDAVGDFGHTATIQIRNLGPGQSHQFTFYHGAAPSKDDGAALLEPLNPDMIWLQSDEGEINGDTFIFAYMSGAPVSTGLTTTGENVTDQSAEAGANVTGSNVTDPSAETGATTSGANVTANGPSAPPTTGPSAPSAPSTPPDRDCSVCSSNAFCSVVVDASVICTCADGFEDVHGDGSVCLDIDECRDEAYSSQCDHLAYCVNSRGSWDCVCPEGFLGDGFSCLNDAFGIRLVATITGADSFNPEDFEFLKIQYASLILGGTKLSNATIVETMPLFVGASTFGARLLGVSEGPNRGNQVTLWALFETFEKANATLAALGSPNWVAVGATSIEDGPAVYRWRGGSTSDALEIPPTGLSVDSVIFDIDCSDSGCWKIDVTYTTGSDDFNVFFIPRANALDSLSYDPSYSAVDGTWGISEADTFLPANHPCTSMDYDPSSGDLAAAVTACCIPEFLSMYRPVAAFNAALTTTGADLSACGTGDRSRAVSRSSVPWFVQFGQSATDANSFLPPQTSSVVNNVFVDGVFSGMTISNIYHTEVVDAYIGVYKARLELDEVELRTKAGQLRGTVGVEHTVDTFVGLVNFSPTGSKVLDTGAVQVNIHLEKTSFFSVSTLGTNDYTFLEYINMRLVAIYLEDDDFSGVSEDTMDMTQTSSSGQANYVQVTFTLGEKYEVNGLPSASGGLVPYDSVRAGRGRFFSETSMEHKCMQYLDGTSFDGNQKTTFTDRLSQGCAPSATMCSAPASIPDAFVSFNVPLGIDELNNPSSQLDQNIFVDLVVNAIVKPSFRDASMPALNYGGDPYQMKTTLTSSIPIVEGGVNIFCDGLASKTDLKDVANADIVVGSCESVAEFSRLRVKADIASTQLQPQSELTQIDSDSIESGLMTLVIKGDDSYFSTNPGRSEVSIELEDVITIHIMEDGGAGEDASVVQDVLDLMEAGGDDNTDAADGLVTEGYNLNGAFSFWVDRASQRAHLEPRSGLLSLCPFNPPRPLAGASPLETCVTRRDVRYREFPYRTGAVSTAMEICAGGICPSSTTSPEASFFASIFADSAYAKALAVSYAGVINTQYALNGRYRRAYWVNPGYEWTPTQTGGNSIFSISQKLFLFALITLDEGLATGDSGRTLGLANPTPYFGRRRILLQSTPEEALKDGQSGLGGDAFAFQTSPAQLMAKVFNVPVDRVATFSVTLQLTDTEACMEAVQLQGVVRTTLDDYLSGAASAYHTVQLTKLAVDKGDVACTRRLSPRRGLKALSSATAEFTMLVVFKEGPQSHLSVAKLETMPRIAAVEPLVVSPKIDSEAPIDFVPDKEDTNSSGSFNVAHIAGIAGGVGAFLILIGAVVYMRRPQQTPVASAVQTVDYNELKAQLACDV